ncbi:hypothetical protein K5D34_12255 [Pseudomonas cichorii]|nr:hypothetical protein [Pseudomonas cichorii]MBX8488624.1 hypothetical protein [Pseudomonas cichorii]MBX8510450.1 hypothetical protein [Pseudomonas cichorii]MBX8518762.1 hypothetical protein [Pseudomonas cichorii]MBX8523882.1 hypothetical protein [Pseudomonas cichorii]MBX8536451.1 hypothetical protein [Pseudomonas cichorii]
MNWLEVQYAYYFMMGNEVKISIASAIFLAVISTHALADFESVMISQQAFREIGGECIGSKSKIQLLDGKVSITNEVGKTYKLSLDDQDQDLPAYLGSAQKAGVCVAAFKYAENSVNESFTLFVFDQTSGEFKPSRAGLVTNPEFLNGKILSNYKDGPTTHNDTLCYSAAKNDYYACEKREQFSELFERREVCADTSCTDPEIVREGTVAPVEAIVSIPKVHFFDMTDDAVFTERKAYLVQGNKVILSDYRRNAGGLYYKVAYVERVKTTGWIPENAIKINN